MESQEFKKVHYLLFSEDLTNVELAFKLADNMENQQEWLLYKQYFLDLYIVLIQRVKQSSVTPEQVHQLNLIHSLILYSNKNLTYHHKHISKFPEGVRLLKNVTFIDCKNSFLEELPEELGKLTKLKELLCTENTIRMLPDSLLCLKLLRTFDISHNQLKELPENIDQWQNLEFLDAEANQLSALPQKIGQLPLRFLNVSHNPLDEFPVQITHLNRLELLFLSSCNLVQIPAEFSRLKSLKTLSLNNNHLKEIPECILELENLESLDLQHNRIRKIPDGISRMSKLKRIDIRNNNIPFISSELHSMYQVEIQKSDYTANWGVNENMTDKSEQQHMEAKCAFDLRFHRLMLDIAVVLETGFLTGTFIAYSLSENDLIMPGIFLIGFTTLSALLLIGYILSYKQRFIQRFWKKSVTVTRVLHVISRNDVLSLETEHGDFGSPYLHRQLKSLQLKQGEIIKVYHYLFNRNHVLYGVERIE